MKITKDMFIAAVEEALKTDKPCSYCVYSFIPDPKTKKKKKACYWCRKLIIHDNFAWLRLTFNRLNCVCPCGTLFPEGALRRARLLVEEYKKDETDKFLRHGKEIDDLFDKRWKPLA